MSRGIVIFGVNNSQIDYIKLSIVCAMFARKNMPGTPIALITDRESKENYESCNPKTLLNYFDNIILLPDKQDTFENTRSFRDTRYHTVNAAFRNETRSQIYSLSPFDETLLIDADYFICNNSFDAVWGCKEDFLINKKAISLSHKNLSGDEYRLNPYGIRMYWATVIYFKKCAISKNIFDMVDHIKDNWEYYTMLYDMPGKLFRNDYAFSIAIHTLGGLIELQDIVNDFPVNTILTATDYDQLYKIKSHDSLLFFVNDMEQNWKFNAVVTKGINVHCMNKISVLNNADDIMEMLS